MTVNAPTVLIGSAITILRRSISMPVCALSASEISCEVTEPNSRPAPPPLQVTVTVTSLGDLHGLGALLGLPLGGGLVVHAHGVDVVGRGLHGQLSRQQIVAAVAFCDLNHLAALSLAANILL